MLSLSLRVTLYEEVCICLILVESCQQRGSMEEKRGDRKIGQKDDRSYESIERLDKMTKIIYRAFTFPQSHISLFELEVVKSPNQKQTFVLSTKRKLLHVLFCVHEDGEGEGGGGRVK